jgi:hypothetical protein
MVYRTGDNQFGTAKWIVDPVACQGTHTTIATALTSASSGDTIVIRPATYTENLTLKAGVNLCAFPSDSGLNGDGTSVANVIINGTCTMTTAGTVTISGIQLRTNSAFFLAVTGSAASIVNLVGCYLNCLNNNGISFTTSSSSAQINIWSCTGNIALNSVTLAVCTSPGTFLISYSDIESTAVTTVASTFNTTTLLLEWSLVKFPVSTTSASLSANYSQINSANSTGFTSSTSGVATWKFCTFQGGTSSTVSIGAGTTSQMESCMVESSNTNAITGAGTLIYSSVGFVTSAGINVTTQTPLFLAAPKIQVSTDGTGPGQIISGTGSPNGSITAPIGSLYLRVDGSSSTTRAYINTNSGTAWTAITTVA